MVIEKSKELLEKLHRTNYKQVPDFGMDTMSETLIRIITNECKSTVVTSDEEGNIQSKKYESDIIKENLHQVIRQLILNGRTIPKKVMNNIMYSHGVIIGVNSDVQLYKGIIEKEDGSLIRTATIGKSVISLTELNSETLELLEEQVNKKYARQFVLANVDKLPHVSKFSIFKERILHGREDKDFIYKQFVSVLKSQTGYNEELIKTTANYYLDYMYGDKFKTLILEATNNGTTLIPIESRGKNTSFNQLKNVISAETQDLQNLIPDINQLHEDIQQVYADVESQLLAYSTDITSLDSNQIEEIIKQINKISFQNSELQQYLGETGYRKARVGIKGSDVRMVDVKRVPLCMRRLATDIQELVQNASSMDREEYLKRAVQLNYRFIRIHPFIDSNGRTSRALLNMMTIPKGILIEVPKEEKKSEFVKAQCDTNVKMGEQGYFEALNDDLKELKQIEQNTEDSPTYEFIKNNCVVDIQPLENCTKELQNEIIQEQELE